MAMEDVILGQLGFIAAIAMAVIGVYGFASSRSLVRQLLSIEVLFNAVLIMVVILMSFSPLNATLLAIALISIVSGEVIVVVAVIAAVYRFSRTFESSIMEEEGV
ncbi:MAG: NADH-quinone oxidoreductase subunit K [Desulfurococcales archaeon]|nr:NADH-quinone oxidoreductase subunit K [Desulfurococcales archaeon]MEB3779802.1 NADH-quinone oxidoreductase subunit K [Desulfurococcales archaeon]